ncbi:MAG: DUF1501 domain-containing protein [Phycisphaera sp.]|nr:DUF1501 domain-containing protein [Phycisphaera sp.]
MCNHHHDHDDRHGACHSADHVSRRTLLRAAGLSGLAWMTPVAQLLALDAETSKTGRPAKSIILVWLGGGPSQLETFDPKPNSPIAYGTGAIDTSLKGVRFAPGLEQTAELMHEMTLVRSVTSKEGDHERATYNVKTGYRPDPTLVHPSIGAVLCHELPVAGVEIPRHVSILPNQWAGRGGYLGDKYDAFRINDTNGNIPDVKPRVPDDREKQRLADLDVVNGAFANRRIAKLEDKTLHKTQIDAALKMMTSEQLKAFDVTNEPADELAAFGDTPFGRGCLAAVRLVSVGVRCVEVTLDGWDTHIENHAGQAKQLKTLDPALSALIRTLKKRNLYDDTVVIIGGEFGRTPKLNGADGRDHWPHGFTIGLAGGPFRRGYVHGETDPQGSEKVADPMTIPDIHATLMHALDIDPGKLIYTPVGRPMELSKGKITRELLAT